jgi:hypothetical protein
LRIALYISLTLFCSSRALSLHKDHKESSDETADLVSQSSPLRAPVIAEFGMKGQTLPPQYCKSMLATGHCRFGSSCKFAHSKVEIDKRLHQQQILDAEFSRLSVTCRPLAVVLAGVQ